ncbi:MAG: metallophosphoesterase family protein [Desulfarculaceae bacterium]|jgi:diadenosine tetraphosphatase ApaH/serine/threonine PP2A family protein phosphatase
MRLAVISDIHGNLEACQEVLTDIGRAGADSVVCLGDNVGYGPNPEEVMEIIRARRIPCVLGNHELALVQPRMLDWFNATVRQVLAATKELLSPASLEFMASLPFFLVIDGLRLVHGCPPESATEYLFEVSRASLARRLQEIPELVCFVGHTHLLEGYLLEKGELRPQDLDQGIYPLKPGERYLFNVGSVGQPRDGDPRAKYVIYDSQAHTLEVRFVPYDIASTAAKIRALGFPEYFAARLESPL